MTTIKQLYYKQLYYIVIVERGVMLDFIIFKFINPIDS